MKKFISLLVLAAVLFSLLSLKLPEDAQAYPLNPQAPIIFGGDMHMVESADLNLDGNNDLVVTDGKNIRGIGVLLGNGNGTFQTPQLIGDGDTYEWGLKIADLNNDTYADIAVGNGALSQMQIYINDGTGNFPSFSAISMPSIGSGHGNLDVGDIDGDGDIDLVVPGNAGDAFYTLINDGVANFSGPNNFAGSSANDYEELAIGDVNSDTFLDVVATSPNGNAVDIFLGDGAGNFNLDVAHSASSPLGVVLKDVNHDSSLEIIYTQVFGDVIIIDYAEHLLDTISTSQPQYVRVEDINLDGEQDIIFSDLSVNGIRVALGNGSGYDSPVDYYVNNDPTGLAVKDFDGDGQPDVAAVNHGDTLSIFLTAAPLTTPGVNIIGTPASVEGGANGSFQVHLLSNPSDTVAIEFPSISGQSSSTVAGICFVPTGMPVNPGHPYEPCSTWNVSQNVSVLADDDALVEGTHSDELNVNVTSNDGNYNSLVVDNVDVIIYDNEVPTIPGINVVTSTTPGEANVDEQGPTSDTFSVALNGVPTSNVTMTCVAADASQVSFAPALAPYIITPASAANPKNYSVSAVDDSDIEGPHNVILTCTTSSTDNDFDGLTFDLTINIADNDFVDTDSDGDPDTVDIDDDGDNITDLIENAAPNSGDGNDDGIIDSLQKDVASSINNVTNVYNTFALTSPNCDQIISYDTNAEPDNSVLDDTYDYPIGFNNFEVECAAPGDTATIEWILDTQYDTSVWVYRKFLESSSNYVDLSGVTYSVRVIDGEPKTVVSYSVTDGSSLDDDGIANASISDPNGPAELIPTTTTTTTAESGQVQGDASGTLSVTGSNSQNLIVLALILLSIGIVINRKKRLKYI